MTNEHKRDAIKDVVAYLSNYFEHSAKMKDYILNAQETSKLNYGKEFLQIEESKRMVKHLIEYLKKKYNTL